MDHDHVLPVCVLYLYLCIYILNMEYDYAVIITNKIQSYFAKEI